MVDEERVFTFTIKLDRKLIKRIVLEACAEKIREQSAEIVSSVVKRVTDEVSGIADIVEAESISEDE